MERVDSMNIPDQKELFAKNSRQVLRNLQADVEHIEASAVVSRDGLIIASLMSSDIDEDRFGAMCASLLALAAKATTEVDRGQLRQIILDGSKGPILLTHCGTVAVLAVAAHSNAHLGRLIMETRKTAIKIGAYGHVH